MTPENTVRLREEIREEFRRHEAQEGPRAFPPLPPVPVERYASQAFQELETRFLWNRVWLLAGHAGELPEPGSYKLWDEMGVPIIILRGRDGEVRAFENVCQHRGGALVYERCGKVKALACKYHAWTYDLEGLLRYVPDAHEFPGLDPSGISLRRVRCELLGNLILINRDREAKPLIEWLGPLAEDFADFDFDNRQIYETVHYDLDCNWKVAIDSNAEAYHVIAIHPETVHRMLDYRGNAIDLFRNGHSRLMTPYRQRGDGFELLDTSGPGTDPRHALTREAIPNYVVFPNLMISAGEFQFPIITYWPNGVDRTRMVVYYTTPFPGEDPKSRPCRDVVDGFDIALEEDRAPLQSVQRSYSRGLIEHLRFSYAERRLYHHAEEVDRVIGPENVPSHLRVQPVTFGRTADA